MNSQKPNNTLAIIGLVIGGIAILFSFIPCAGSMAILPGVIGLILGAIAFFKAKDNGHPKGLATAALVVSLLACLMAGYQMYRINQLTGNAKEYENCDELKIDYIAATEEFEGLTKEIEEDDSKALSYIGKITRLGFKINQMKEASEKLDCNIDMSDFGQPDDDTKTVEENDSDNVSEEMESEESNQD